jgi:hypothetical protein
MRGTFEVFLVLAILPLFLGAGCATSRGSTYADQEGEEAAAARKSRQVATQPSDTAPPAPSAAVPSDSAFALANGSGSIQVSAPSPPPQPKATLLVENLDRAAAIIVDGLEILSISGPQGSYAVDVTPGTHWVELRRFGFEDISVELEFEEDVTTRYEPVWRLVGFGLRSLVAWPELFDPADPGALGSTVLRAESFALGRFNLVIVDASGERVWNIEGIEVGESGWSWRWDGRDIHGKELGPGSYVVTARAENGQELLRTPITIVTGRYARSALLHSGTGGTLFAPAARPMEADGIEFTGGLVGHVVDSIGRPIGRLAVQLGSRVGIPLGGSAGGLENSLEFDLSGMFVLHPGSSSEVSTDSYTLTAALLVPLSPLSKGPVFTALLGKFSYGSFLEAGDRPSPGDAATRFPGLSLGLPIEFDQGNLRGFFSPEIEVGLFHPGYDPARVSGLFVWAYLRGGIEVTLGDLTAALSAALRSMTFDQGFGIDLPIEAGVEIRWHLPEAPLVVSVVATGEFDRSSSWYLNSGLSIGFRL